MAAELDTSGSDLPPTRWATARRDGVLKHGEDVGETNQTNPKNPIFDSTYMM